MDLVWQIREATLEDAEGLGKSMESAYTHYQERMEGVRLPPMDADYSSEIENYPTWVVESEGNILGGLIMIFEKGNASIANIAVNPKLQGQGIGSGLMKFAELMAKENNFSELYLTTHVLLKENLSIYRHLGWEEIGRDNTKVFMKKEI
jgi:N-acetylglutamate synthase-like GNAT family acetyltransferase